MPTARANTWDHPILAGVASHHPTFPAKNISCEFCSNFLCYHILQYHSTMSNTLPPTRVCHSPIFVENKFGKCLIKFSVTIEHRKCNFWVKNIFPKVPSRGVKVKNIEISMCFKVSLVGTLNLFSR